MTTVTKQHQIGKSESGIFDCNHRGIDPATIKIAIKNSPVASAISHPGDAATNPSETSITFSRLTGPEESRLTKAFHIDNADNIIKTSSPNFSSGKAETMVLEKLSDIEPIINSLNPNQCITTGTFDVDVCSIVTMANFSQDDYASGVRTRSKGHMQQPATSIVLFDHDVDSYMPNHLKCNTPTDLMTKVKRAIPEFSNIAYSGTGSSSSGIYRTVDDQPYRSGNGFHVYIPVKNIDLDKFREFMKVRLWNTGLGFISYSRSGAMLERTIIDLAVLSPERLIYEARPILGDGLDQQARVWTHQEGTTFSGEL